MKRAEPARVAGGAALFCGRRANLYARAKAR